MNEQIYGIIDTDTFIYVFGVGWLIVSIIVTIYRSTEERKAIKQSELDDDTSDTNKEVIPEEISEEEISEEEISEEEIPEEISEASGKYLYKDISIQSGGDMIEMVNLSSMDKYINPEKIHKEFRISWPINKI